MVTTTTDGTKGSDKILLPGLEETAASPPVGVIPLFMPEHFSVHSSHIRAEQWIKKQEVWI